MLGRTKRTLLAGKDSPLADVAAIARPLPLRVEVSRAIKDLIIRGELSHGHHLVEVDLAVVLGVSRIPVREALQLLSRDGWVDLRAGYGAFVHTPTAKEIEDVFSIRTVLEAEGAAQAARRVKAQEVELTSLEDLEWVLRKGVESMSGASNTEIVDHNVSLHRAVIDLSGNEELVDLISMIETKVRWYFSAIAVERAPASWQEHVDVVKAIVAGDAQEARELMAMHCENSRLGLLKLRDMATEGV